MTNASQKSCIRPYRHLLEVATPLDLIETHLVAPANRRVASWARWHGKAALVERFRVIDQAMMLGENICDM
jgi:hypothetical protein